MTYLFLQQAVCTQKKPIDLTKEIYIISVYEYVSYFANKDENCGDIIKTSFVHFYFDMIKGLL